MKFFLLILSFLISHNIKAENYLGFFGGGGEPSYKDTTIFDDTVAGLGNFTSKTPAWKNNVVSFNGGHKTTERIMGTNFPNAKTLTTFTEDNFKNLIKNYERDIEKGNIKYGDKLLIVIDTHGAEKNDNSKTHQVASGQVSTALNLNNLNSSKNISLDLLDNLSKLAKAKGIKLGILDFSCHSGNTQSLQNSSTCVISSTGPKHFGFNSFSRKFASNMKSGKNLEDVFLETRNMSDDNSYPMISTPEGNFINKEYYPTITPYLYYHSDEALTDKLSTYLLNVSNNAEYCKRENSYTLFNKQIEELKVVALMNQSNNIPELEKLQKLVSNYKRQQDKAINLLRSMGFDKFDFKKVEKFNVTKPGAIHSIEYSQKELIETNFKSSIDTLTAQKNQIDPTNKNKISDIEVKIELYSKAWAKQSELLSKYPNLNSYHEKLEESNLLQQTQYRDANEIAKLERKIYQNIYQNLKDNNTESNNPCRDFIL